MQEALLSALLSWAVMLSGYPAPSAPPVIETLPLVQLQARACGGAECPIYGWYNDTGTVFLLDTVDMDNPYIKGLIVHEIVHYLQHLQGDTERQSCAQYIAREREAYAVQAQYLVEAHGRVSYLGLIHGAMTCG